MKIRTNEKVVQEILDEEQSEDPYGEEDAACPVCGAISPGAMDCGCYDEIHYGKG